MGFFDTVRSVLRRRPGQAMRPPASVSSPDLEDRLSSLESYYKDVKLRVTGSGAATNISTNIREKTRPPAPIHTYQRGQKVTSQNRGLQDRGLSFEGPIYDLTEIARARDVDSLISTSIERHVEECLMQGVSFTGDDQEALDYVRTRIFEIETVSSVQLRRIVEMIVDNLVAYGTAFLVVNRSNKFSTGKAIRMFGKSMDPISTWAVADAPTMRLAENETGNVIGWEQRVQETGYLYVGKMDRKIIHPYDVFSLSRHLQPGRVFGRSMYTPVLDDVMMLRSLEDLVYIISQKFAFPLVQYKVGTEAMPAGDITTSDGSVISEVEYTRATVESMPTEGIFVTPERHEISLLGTQGEVLDLDKYLQHFRNRVQEGCRLSNAVLGTNVGDQSKSTAQSQMKGLQDSASYLQDLVVEGFRPFIFQLLMEGGFDITEENMVELSFSRSNPEEDRANENHVMSQYQGDVITHEEMRNQLKKQPLKSTERGDLFSESNHKKDLQMARLKAAQKAATAGSSTRKKKSSASKKSTTSKTKPTNQHKTKATKTRVKANDFMSAATAVWKDCVAKIRSGKTMVEVVGEFDHEIREVCRLHLATAVSDGVYEARAEVGNPCLLVSNEQYGRIVDGAMDRLNEVLAPYVHNTGSLAASIAVFDAARTPFEDSIERAYLFAERAGKAAGYYNAGKTKISILGQPDVSSATMDAAEFCDKLFYFMDESATLKAS